MATGLTCLRQPGLVKRLANDWTNGHWELDVGFCMFRTLFSASELSGSLKSQDLLASGKHSVERLTFGSQLSFELEQEFE